MKMKISKQQNDIKICADCKHFTNRYGYWPLIDKFQRVYLCKRHSSMFDIDTITGFKRYKNPHNLPFDECSDFNSRGQCPSFEKKFSLIDNLMDRLSGFGK